MQFLLLIYNDPELIEPIPPEQLDDMLRSCFAHTDELEREGRLLQSMMLGQASAARSVRVRKGRTTAVDGPFAETREVLAGFNLIEADSMEEAVEIANHFPWTGTGCVEVRPVEDLEAVKRRVSAAGAGRERAEAASTGG